ncbi:hypothetical protein BLNAU_16830 [Blattamonas nauphoetae]|uniref:Protein kinase domain-containing protein n=1 Tax=Blattamonas nauphoetae TaxID=2049346 RepID=A0ABQ9X7Z8_9EUKA|nr:hypothetical protein BLNAU_16830 [Blattamonas nauphoetae]
MDPDIMRQMSKKIAQLTRVIYQLHTKNDDYELELQRISENSQAEVSMIIEETKQKIATMQKALDEAKSQNNSREALKELTSKYESEKQQAYAEFSTFQRQATQNEQRLKEISELRIRELVKEVSTAKESFDKQIAQLKAQVSDSGSSSQKLLKEQEENHQTEISRLVKEQNAKYNEMLTQRYKAEADLEKKLDVANKELDELRKSKEEEQRKRESLEHLLEKERSENEAATKRFSEDIHQLQQQYERDMKSKNDEIARMQDQIAAQLDQIANSSDASSELMSELQNLKKSKADLESDKEKLSEEMRQKLNEMSKREKDLQTQLDSEMKNNQNLQMQLKNYTSQSDSQSKLLQTQISSLTEQLNAERQKFHDQLTNLKSSNETEITTLKKRYEQEVESLNRTIEQLKTQSSASMEDVNKNWEKRMSEEAQKMKELHRKDLEEANTKAEEEKRLAVSQARAEQKGETEKEKDEEIARLTAQFEKEKTELEKRLTSQLAESSTDAAQQMNNLRQQLTDEERARKEAEEEGRRLASLLEKEQRAKEGTMSDGEKLRAELDEERKKKAETDEELRKEREQRAADRIQFEADLSTKNEEMTKLKSEHEQALRAKEAEIAKMRDENAAQLEKLASSSTASSQLLAELEGLKKEKTGLEADKAKLGEELRKKMAEMDEKQRALQNELDMLKREKEMQEKALSSSAASKDDTIRSLQSQLDQAREDSSARQRELEGEIEALKQQHAAEISRAVEAHKKQMAMLHASHESESIQYQSKMEEMEQKWKDKLHNAGEKSERERREAEEKHAKELERKLRENTDTLTKTFEKKLADLEGRLNEEHRRAMDRTLSDQNSQMETKQSQFLNEARQMKAALEDQLRQMEALERDLDSATQANSALTAQNEELLSSVTSLESQISQANKTNRALSLEVSQLTTQNSNLSDQLSQLHADCDRLAAESTELQNELAEVLHRYEHRDPRPEDIQRIRQLEAAVVEKEHLLARMNEEVKFYKLELRNRDENYTKTFGRTNKVGSIMPGGASLNVAPSQTAQRNATPPSVQIINEYAPSDSLNELYHKFIHNTQKFSEDMLWSILFSCCECLSVLNQLGICHGNLHPSNIFSTPSNNFIIGDFYISTCVIGPSRKNPHKPLVATDPSLPSTYSAPEIQKGDKPDLASDLYSVGVIIREIIAISAMNTGISEELLFTSELRHLAHSLSHESRTERPTLYDLMHNPSIVSIRDSLETVPALLATILRTRNEQTIPELLDKINTLLADSPGLLEEVLATCPDFFDMAIIALTTVRSLVDGVIETILKSTLFSGFTRALTALSSVPTHIPQVILAILRHIQSTHMIYIQTTSLVPALLSVITNERERKVDGLQRRSSEGTSHNQRSPLQNTPSDILFDIGDDEILRCCVEALSIVVFEEGKGSETAKEHPLREIFLRCNGLPLLTTILEAEDTGLDFRLSLNCSVILGALSRGIDFTSVPEIVLPTLDQSVLSAQERDRQYASYSLSCLAITGLPTTNAALQDSLSATTKEGKDGDSVRRSAKVNEVIVHSSLNKIRILLLHNVEELKESVIRLGLLNNIKKVLDTPSLFKEGIVANILDIFVNLLFTNQAVLFETITSDVLTHLIQLSSTFSSDFISHITNFLLLVSRFPSPLVEASFETLIIFSLKTIDQEKDRDHLSAHTFVNQQTTLLEIILNLLSGTLKNSTSSLPHPKQDTIERIRADERLFKIFSSSDNKTIQLLSAGCLAFVFRNRLVPPKMKNVIQFLVKSVSLKSKLNGHVGVAETALMQIAWKEMLSIDFAKLSTQSTNQLLLSLVLLRFGVPVLSFADKQYFIQCGILETLASLLLTQSHPLITSLVSIILFIFLSQYPSCVSLLVQPLPFKAILLPFGFGKEKIVHAHVQLLVALVGWASEEEVQDMLQLGLLPCLCSLLDHHEPHIVKDVLSILLTISSLTLTFSSNSSMSSTQNSSLRSSSTPTASSPSKQKMSDQQRFDQSLMDGFMFQRKSTHSLLVSSFSNSSGFSKLSSLLERRKKSELGRTMMLDGDTKTNPENKKHGEHDDSRIGLRIWADSITIWIALLRIERQAIQNRLPTTLQAPSSDDRRNSGLLLSAMIDLLVEINRINKTTPERQIFGKEATSNKKAHTKIITADKLWKKVHFLHLLDNISWLLKESSLKTVEATILPLVFSLWNVELNVNSGALVQFVQSLASSDRGKEIKHLVPKTLIDLVEWG